MFMIDKGKVIYNLGNWMFSDGKNSKRKSKRNSKRNSKRKSKNKKKLI